MSQYFHASTATPTGWRPWNFAMQGLGSLRGARRMGRLGEDAAAGDVGAAQAQANSIAAQLAQVNRDLVASQNAVMQLSLSGVDMSSEGQLLLQARNKYESAVSQFTTAYRALFGTVPPGLSGMGRLGIPAATIAWIVVVLASVAAAIYEINKLLNTIQQSIAVKQTQANTQAVAVSACASGDAASCASLTALQQAAAGAPQPPTDWTSWLQNNALMIGLVFGGIIIIPKILRKI
jgi:hypothetical protein